MRKWPREKLCMKNKKQWIRRGDISAWACLIDTQLCQEPLSRAQHHFLPGGTWRVRESSLVSGKVSKCFSLSEEISLKFSEEGIVQGSLFRVK